MIKFGRLSIKNFMSIRELVSLELSPPGLFLITGRNLEEGIVSNSNGAGKSTLLEALVWVLFGRTIRPVNLDDIVNRDVGCDTHVSIQFSIDEDYYLVERFRKHSHYNNNLMLFRNTLSLTKANMKNTQEMLERILGINYRTFVNSVIFGHGLTDFFTTLNDNAKKELLEDILELNIFSNCQDVNKIKLKMFDHSIIKVNNTIVQNETLLRKIVSDLEGINAKITELEKQELEEKGKLQSELDKQIAFFSELSGIESSIRREIKEIAIELQEKEAKLIPETQRIEKDLVYIKARLETLKFQEESILKEIGTVNEKLSKIKDVYLGNKCSFCGQIITEEQMPCVQSSTIAALAEKNSLLESIRKDTNMYLEKSKELVISEKDQEDLRRYTNIGQRRTELQNQLMDIAVQGASCKTEVKSLRSRLKESSSITPFYELRSSLEKQFEECKVAVSKLVSARHNLVERRKYFEFWDVGFSYKGIRAWALNSYLPYVNRLINNYANLIGLGNITIELYPVVAKRAGDEIDKIELVINGGIPYGSFSSGEQRRIDLSILFAMQELLYNRTSNPINILFFDEIFDTLDETGSSMIIDVLDVLCSKFYDSVFVISHNEWLKPYFANHIQVVKENNTTYIETQKDDFIIERGVSY